jgi:hypothetical protein
MIAILLSFLLAVGLLVVGAWWVLEGRMVEERAAFEAWAKMGAGACWNAPQGQLGPMLSGDLQIMHETPSIVPCAQPHHFEVFAVGALPLGAGGTYPGDKAALDWAKLVCPHAFRDYVGIDFTRSSLEIVLLVPTAPGWDAGWHGLACSVDDPLSPLAHGTLAGSGR